MKEITDIEREALSYIRSEKNQWETATAFVVERVAFQMRNLIRQMRKLYYGVFDNPFDPSGREKIWIPLVESMVDAVVKNIDLDTKDINFRSRKSDKMRLTHLVRAAVKVELDKMGFGEALDDEGRTKCIDGTAVWKTVEYFDEKDKKTHAKIVKVDTLNLYLDPTTPQINSPDGYGAYRITERALLTEDEVRNYKGWDNVKDIEGSYNLARTDANLKGLNSGGPGMGGLKMVDVWESFGYYPGYLLTGDRKNDKDEVKMHIVASGIDAPGKERIHLIEKWNKLYPYEEDWYIRVPNRWYGRGVAEKLWKLQVWLNTVVNIRINRAYLAQLGIFKIRKSSGITAQLLSRLAANGVIPVNNLDDIEQLQMADASQASYNDEENIYGWAQKNTSAYDSITGEQLPSSTPATNAAISQQNSASQFVLIRKGTGMFLQRWLKNHVLPIVLKNLKKGDVLNLTGDPDDLQEFDEAYINKLMADEIDRMNGQGIILSPENISAEYDRAMSKMKALGNRRYATLEDELDHLDYDTEIDITNEEIDKGVLSQNLMGALQAAPEYRDQILQEVFDLMGLSFKKPKTTPAPMNMPGFPGQSVNQMGQGTPVQAGAPMTPQRILTQANTMRQ